VRAEGWAEADKAEAQRNPGAKREHRIILGHAPRETPATESAGNRYAEHRLSEDFQSPTRGGVRKGYAAHIWKSELALVRDNSERDVLSSVFAPVRSKIDF
jgi:hypothetical protein